MLARGAVLEFRVRQDWASILLKEARGLPASPAPEKDEELESLRTLTLEFTAAVEGMWGKFLADLGKHGLPLFVAEPCVRGARVLVDSTRELLGLLHQQGGQGADLARVADTLNRLEREVQGVEAAVAKRPRPDLDRVREGIEQARRGEGEELGAVLAALDAENNRLR